MPLPDEKTTCKEIADFLYSLFPCARWRSSMVEPRFCKPAVVGSSPSASSLVKWNWQGQVAERPMASGCKPDGFTSYGGSNPSLPTCEGRGRGGEGREKTGLLELSPHPSPLTLTPRARGCSLMVKPQPSKLATWVRFPSPACENCRLRIADGKLPDRGF